MTFDTEYSLKLFRDIEPEIFDENGDVYTGIAVTRRQIRLMKDLINQLEYEINSLEGRQP